MTQEQTFGLQILGSAIFCIGACLWSLPVGLMTIGALFVLFGTAKEYSEVEDDRDDTTPFDTPKTGAVSP